MNKDHFNRLITDYSNLKDDAVELDKLISEFPYSQPVRMLNIKSFSGTSKTEMQRRLTLAAFYTTDRNVLRSLVESGLVPSDIIDKTIPPPTKLKQKAKKTTSKTTPPLKEKKSVKKSLPKEKQVITGRREEQSKILDSEQLRKEVLFNLERLQETKLAFLQESKVEKKSTGKSKKKVLESVAVKSEEVKVKTKAVKPAKATVGEPQKPTPSGKDELIDKFIADKPSITRGKPLRENQSDLSKSSSKLKEDLVSENLAVIFAKQGKVGKAIEIYKKLIWKFPQKKASFAARIEELKKKR